MYFYMHVYARLHWKHVEQGWLMHHALAAPFRHCCQEKSMKQACFSITMATLGGKQHFLQGISLSLCEMLPGHGWPRAQSDACHVLLSPLSLPRVPPWFLLEAHGTSTHRCPRHALAWGWRKAWQLHVKAGGDGRRHPKQLFCCFLPTLSSPWHTSRGFMVWGIVYLGKEEKKNTKKKKTTKNQTDKQKPTNKPNRKQPTNWT